MGIVCETKEEYDALKEKAMMVKVILLDKGGDHPLANPSLFSDRKKRAFIKEMTEYMERTTDEITSEFNEVVNNTILAGGADVSEYPVYETPV
jgi:hypothetical protein